MRVQQGPPAPGSKICQTLFRVLHSVLATSKKNAAQPVFGGMWGDLFHVNVTPTPSHHALPFLDSNRPKLRACTELIFAPNCPSALFDQTCDQKSLDFADWIVYIDIKEIYQIVSSIVSLFQKAKLDEPQNAKR